MVQSFTRTRPSVIVGQLLVGLVVEIASDVLGRGIHGGERFQLIEHLVVDAVDHRAHDLLEQLEIEQEAGLVQFGAGQGDADLVVVTVRILAAAVVVPEKVAG
jgi:hypothetical protein